MVNIIREVEAAKGTIYYPEDIDSIPGRDCSRSLFICEDMKAGDVLTEQNLRSIRPGCGLHPKYLNELLGKRINYGLKKGTPMSLDYIVK